MKELDYQIEAIRKLKNTSNELLNLQGNHTIVFKAPTGSGKTVMMAEFMKEMLSNQMDGKKFSFIWTAPRKLHSQSKEKLEKHYKDSKALKCSYFDDLSDRMIGENEILFLNWESINQEDNIIICENEQEFNLSNVIINTVDDGRTIILIIDESHHAANTETSRGLIHMFNPKVTIEVSATPKLSGDETVTVYRENVIEEEMIKKKIAINPDFKNIISGDLTDGVRVKSSAEDSANDLIINIALAKRESLSKHFDDVGSNVNPLMLIQLPDRRRGSLDVKDEVIKILKDKHNIHVDNDKLAIYLSKNKEHLETITNNDSSVEVMIFKQAIALGWDCPRASILVLFRDWQSIVFSIQTVGRIMRMPELKHYPSEDLNVGYVYTNLSDISIHQDIADGYATIQYAIRKNNYENIQLRSVHSKRQRERTRLSPIFIEHFLNSAKDLDLKNKISTYVNEIKRTLISDGVITEPDKEFEHLQNGSIEAHSGNTVERVQNEEEVQMAFDNFIAESLSPIFPEARSVGRVKDSIYRFLENKFPKLFQYGSVDAQMIVLDKNNNRLFRDVINQAKETYQKEVRKKVKELETDENWEVPSSLYYPDEYQLNEKNLSIIEPFYEKINASNPEKHFVEFLENKANKINWWYKNGERDGTFFAIPYIEENENKPFYVDWIVKYKDGRIGLFDTKAGWTAKTTGSRAEGLAKYIKKENKKGKNLFGGIVIEKEGSFWLNDKETYKYDENDLRGSGWEILS